MEIYKLNTRTNVGNLCTRMVTISILGTQNKQKIKKYLQLINFKYTRHCKKQLLSQSIKKQNLQAVIYKILFISSFLEKSLCHIIDLMLILINKFYTTIYRQYICKHAALDTHLRTHHTQNKLNT